MKDQTLLYFADPMCSWCYGFAPQITDLLTKNKEINFKLIMGGLRPYGKETMKEIKGFLVHHWQEVHDRSGKLFNYAITENEDFIYDTEPPSRAIVVVRKIKPEVEFDFFKDVQKAFYYDNKDTNVIKTYLDLLEKYAVDAKHFKELFESDDIKEQVRSDFEYSASLGVRGFPTTVVFVNGQYYLVAHGYETAGTMDDRLSTVLNHTVSNS